MFPELLAESGSNEMQFLGDSDCIQAAKFFKGDLTIQFTDGTSYVYHNVHVFVWSNFQRVTSKGWFFNHYIRNGGYAFERLS